jgi:hypothetical protein
MSPAIRLVGRDVLFVHWPVDPTALQALVPDQVEVDTTEGSAWVSVVLQEVARVGLDDSLSAPLGVPQLDFRTYVSHEGTNGVYFFTCDTGQQLNSIVGSRTFGLPFTFADISLTRRGDRFVVRSRRKDDSQARFDARYERAETTGPVEPGSVPEFLIKRYHYFTPADGAVVDGSADKLVRGEVERDPWEVGDTTAEIRTNTLFEAIGLDSPASAPIVQYCPTFEATFLGTERLTH